MNLNTARPDQRACLMSSTEMNLINNQHKQLRKCCEIWSFRSDKV